MSLAILLIILIVSVSLWFYFIDLIIYVYNYDMFINKFIKPDLDKLTRLAIEEVYLKIEYQCKVESYNY